MVCTPRAMLAHEVEQEACWCRSEGVAVCLDRDRRNTCAACTHGDAGVTVRKHCAVYGELITTLGGVGVATEILEDCAEVAPEALWAETE